MHPGQNTQQYEPVSFGLSDLDLQASQAEPNHDDSAIVLTDDGLDAKYTTDMQLPPHLPHVTSAVS